MRLASVAALCAVSAFAAGCDGDNSVSISSSTTEHETRGVLKVIDALQCPESIGVLTRKGSAQAGGDTCLYTGPRGAEVTLRLVRLDDMTAESVLNRFENDLSRDMPHTTASLSQAQADQAEAGAARARNEAVRVQAEASAAAGDRASVRGPGMAIDAQGDRARVSLPGMTVNADGEKAQIRIGGFSINADDASQSVNISSSDESVSVQSRDDAAEIRTRAPGSAIRTTYMLTDDRPAEAGWRLVGYEARGPAGGPIVIATVRAKERDSDGVFDAAKDLVTLNVGR